MDNINYSINDSIKGSWRDAAKVVYSNCLKSNLNQYILNNTKLENYNYSDLRFSISKKDIPILYNNLNSIGDLVFFHRDYYMIRKFNNCFILGILFKTVDLVTSVDVDVYHIHLCKFSLEKIKEDITKGINLIKPCRIKLYSDNEHGSVTKIFNDLLEDIIHPESYPYIDLENYTDRFLESTSRVLIINGPPGTGKTSFIRRILQKAKYSDASSKIKSSIYNDDDDNDERVDVLYTTDKKSIESSELFIDFLEEESKFLVLEDIDFHLEGRKSGNTMMYTLLGISDGLIHYDTTKKIILSTNLPGVRDIDEALTREGRCFDILKTRKLNYDEAVVLANKLNKKIVKEQDYYSLGEIYNLPS